MNSRPPLLAGALLGALLATLPACGPGEGEFSVSELRAHVRVVQLARGRVERSLHLSGVVEPYRSARLVPSSPGEVVRLPVKVGEAVREGQVVAELDSELARLQLQQAQAALKLAEFGRDTARRAFERAEALHQAGSLTDQQYEQAKSGLDMAEQQVQQAEAAVGLARKALEGTRLTAPFDGVVVSLGAEVGDTFNPMSVSPMGGAPSLVEVAELDRVRLDAEAAEDEVGLIEPGQLAHLLPEALRDQLPGGLDGRVESVGQVAEPVTRTFPVRVVAENPEHLVKPGMHAELRVVLEARDGVLVLPERALREEGGETWVQVVSDGRVRRVAVEPGLRGDQGVEIRSGLEGGEQVVVEGGFGLPDGTAVEASPWKGEP